MIPGSGIFGLELNRARQKRSPQFQSGAALAFIRGYDNPAHGDHLSRVFEIILDLLDMQGGPLNQCCFRKRSGQGLEPF